jgi:thioredoxin 1
MLERFLILAAVLIVPLFILTAVRKKKTVKKINFNLFTSHGIEINNSRPSVIYFWSDYCAPCTLQKELLDRLKKKYFNINFISLNAVKEKELVSSFNIKTVPSIAIISSENEMKFLNRGFTGEEKLKKELEDIY